MINTDLENASKIMIGSQEAEAIYVGSTPIWQSIQLPYDTEIEYIESSGTQYIDTEIVPEGSFSIETCIAITNSSQNSTILGSVETGNIRYYSLGYNGTPYVCKFNGSWNNSYIANGSKLNLNTFYNISTLIDNNKVSITCNDTTNTVNYVSGTNTKSLYLFCRHATNPQYFAYCKMKYIKMYQDNELICHLIPVRKGDVGYMFDKISKRLYENNGTGEFILGPDM